jgi:hypothetical protein
MNPTFGGENLACESEASARNSNCEPIPELRAEAPLLGRDSYAMASRCACVRWVLSEAIPSIIAPSDYGDSAPVMLALKHQHARR